MGSYNVKVGGTWRPAQAVHVKAGGAWRAAKEVWVKAGGTWRLAWSALTAAVAGGFTPQYTGVPDYPKDRAVLSVATSPSGQTITAYAWSYTDYDGALTYASSTSGSTLTLEGPSYYQFGFNNSGTVVVSCTVTINGQQYTTPEVTLNYTKEGA